MARALVRTRMQRYDAAGQRTDREDQVAGEEPLEIRVNGAALATTMRTPGHDIELVHGFLHAEGVITAADDVRTAQYCDGVGPDGRNTYNVLNVSLAAGLRVAADRVRTVPGSSACGVCGSSSIQALAQRTRYPLSGGTLVSPQTLLSIPATLTRHQAGFAATGGSHATALFTSDGELELIREDVGRHNAMDKVIGAALLAGRLPLRDSLLVTTSRASFELVQKAVLAGCPALVATSAPSSLAIERARDQHLTLVGFSRTSGFNVYAGGDRIG